MKKHEFWQNFALNRELHVTGSFIYDGIRDLHSMKSFQYPDEVFQVVYSLAAGIERLLKVCVILCEYTEGMDPTAFEKTLITHDHHQLLKRVKSHAPVRFTSDHNRLLQILSKFYKSYRYDSFNLKSAFTESAETEELVQWIGKDGRFPEVLPNDRFGFEQGYECSVGVKMFLGKTVKIIVETLYEVVENRARSLNLFTYEIRYGSKAYKVFMLKTFDFNNESLLWKEILIYLMNQPSVDPRHKELRALGSLPFDLNIATCLRCLGSDLEKIEHFEHLQHLHEQVPDLTERLEVLESLENNFDWLTDEEMSEMAAEAEAEAAEDDGEEDQGTTKQ